MSDERYRHGDVVWCKCGGLYWPGEVKGLSSLPEEIREGFLKMPLVVVKFFDEDGYEFVLNDKDIYPYNCDKKEQFILKGLARCRTKTKEGATGGWFAKFPKDVIHCERVTGGNPALLEQEPYAERKDNKVDYSKIFKAPEAESKSAKTDSKKPANSSKTPESKKLAKTTSATPMKKLAEKDGGTLAKSKIGEAAEKKRASGANSGRATKLTTLSSPGVPSVKSEHKVRILTQPSTPYHLDLQGRSSGGGGAGATKPTGGSGGHGTASQAAGYTCHICGFAATRLNVIILHSKTHSSGGARNNLMSSPGSGNTIKNSLVQKTSSTKKTERPFRDDRVSSTSSRKRDKPSLAVKFEKKASLSPQQPAAKKPRLTKKQREERREQEQRKQQEKQRLLGDWSEDEHQEEEEYKKLQESIVQSQRALGDLSDEEEEEEDIHHSMDSDEEAPPTINNRTVGDGIPSSSPSPHPPDPDAMFSPASKRPRPSSSGASSFSAEAPSTPESAHSVISSLIKSKLDPQRMSTSPLPSPVKQSSATAKEEESRKSAPAVKSSSSSSSSPSNVSPVRKPAATDAKAVDDDAFDINQVLEDTALPELPSFSGPGLFGRSFSPRKSRLVAPADPETREKSVELSAELTKKEERSQSVSPPASPPPRKPGILKKTVHTSIQLPTRPDGNSQLIRNASPGSGTKFASISAKVKAKQLARSMQLTEVKNSSGSTTQAAAAYSQQQSTAAPTQKEESALADSAIPSTTAAERVGGPIDQSATTPSVYGDVNGVVDAAAPAEPLAPVAVEPSVPVAVEPSVAVAAAENSHSGGGNAEGQIYYMLVDENSQLDNHTILIDESQLAAVAASGHLISQPGSVILQGGPGGELLLPGGGELYQGGTTAVLLQAENGQILNVVVAQDKDLRSGCLVTSADTSGGIATLPSHPSSSVLSQVPLITTPALQQPIMATSTLGESATCLTSTTNRV